MPNPRPEFCLTQRPRSPILAAGVSGHAVEIADLRLDPGRQIVLAHLRANRFDARAPLVHRHFQSDMKGLGLKDLTLQQIVRLRDHGITPGFVNHAKARGFKPVDADDLIRLKNGGLYRDKP